MKLCLRHVFFLGIGSWLICRLCLLAQEKRIVQPEDLVDIRGVSDVQVSRDGRRVAFVVTEPADPKKPRRPRDTNIWVVPVNGSEPARPFASSPKSDIYPRWSPDGRYLAFLSDRGEPTEGSEEERELELVEKEPKRQIYLMPTDGGEAEPMTNFKGGVEKFEWSPDSTRIALTVKDPLTDEEERKRKERDDVIYVDHGYKFARLRMLTLADRKTQQLTRQDLHVSSFAWSPDSNCLAIKVSATPQVDDVTWHSSLVVINSTSGELLRTISKNVNRFSSDADFKWSPDGRTISYAQYTPNKIASWLALAPVVGSTPPWFLLKEYRGTLWGVEWAPDSKHLLAESQEGTKARILSVDAASGAITKLDDVLAPGFGFSVSADGRTIAFLNQAAHTPSDVWVLRVDEPPRRLTNLNPQVASWRLGEVREITWKNRKDGQTLFGVLITPPDFKPGQPFPTIVEVHGGPQWAWWTGWHGSWHEWGQLLASHGYVVFLPNPRGSTGQGWQFAEANRDDWGGMDFQDIMDGVDRLIDQKIADPDHLGIGGWSYGGFMTSWAVTQTGRFRAAVVGAGVTDLFSFDGTTDITPSFLRNYFLDIPFRRRSAYDNHSALTFIQNCKTPTLVLHGRADERVPVGQGWEFYEGLRMLGVPTEMAVYPREHHGFKERAHQIDLLKRILGWYDRHLKP